MHPYTYYRKMLDRIKNTLRYFIIFLAAAAACLCMLILAALIPTERIHDKMLSSAEMLCEKEVFYDLSDDISASRIDRYADSILLNIAYHLEGDDPLASAMNASYYFTDTQNENKNLLDAVNGGLDANKEYIRYWHGPVVLVKLAHLFTDIHGMYIINAALMLIQSGLLLFVLIKHRLYAGAVGTVCALAAAGIWYVPFSLEYTWVFLIEPVVSVIAVKLVLAGKREKLGALFMLSGIVTNYLDFLTAETVTLTLPLLLTIYTLRTAEKRTFREDAVMAVKLCALWGIGYIGMWVLKWSLAAVVLGEDVTPYIGEHIAERSLGQTAYMESESIFSVLARNIGCLFPLGFGGMGVIAAVFLVIAGAYVCFVYRKDGIKPADLIIYTAVGLLPYLRYAVLFNHSYLHFFFTYRAQAALILAACLMISETVGFGRAKHEAHKRKRA